MYQLTQRLGHRESDVQKLNESKDTLAAFASKYRKMELRLESHEKLQVELDTHIT